MRWLLPLPMLMSVCLAQDYPARPIPPGVSPRDRFLKLIERPRVPLADRQTVVSTSDGLTEIAFEFDAEAGERVPGLLIRGPGDGPQPVVIALHGTGGSKDALRPLLQSFAARGLTGVAIDGRYAGVRAGGAARGDAYRSAILDTWNSGQKFPFFYDTVWDTLRLLDYLETREDVDRHRIGAIGFSKGGIELYLAAAADDRLAAVVPCIGVQSFGWALEHNAWQSRVQTIQSAVAGAAGNRAIDGPFVGRFYDRVAPGIHCEFDGPAMLPSISPRPLLVINGALDDRTPAPGLELCVAAAREAYQAAGAAGQFEFVLQPETRHAVTPATQQYALEWLSRKLRPESAPAAGAQ